MMLPRTAFLAVISLAAALACVGQQANNADELPGSVNVSQWLAGPERADYKWKVELGKPQLTFQQRYLVQLRAVVDPGPLPAGATPDFYFALEIADKEGEWLPGHLYKHFAVPPKFSKQNEIEYTAGFYAKPGTYTAALVLVDAVSGKGNVWRKPFEVKAPKNDPLPQLDREIPAIEYAGDVPEDAEQHKNGDGFPFWWRRRGIDIVNNDASETALDEWPPGHGTQFLPVHNPQPLRLDVVLNLAPPVDPYMQRETKGEQYRATAGAMTQIAAVLSQLGLSDGCVRVSGIDLAKLEVVFKPIDGRGADWDELSKRLEKRDTDTISVKALGKQASTADFLATYLSGIVADGSGCEAGAGGEHAIVFVSRNFVFRGGGKLAPPQPAGLRYFLIRVNRSGGGDDLDGFFKTVKARRFEVDSPEQFRGALAKMAAELGSGK